MDTPRVIRRVSLFRGGMSSIYRYNAVECTFKDGAKWRETTENTLEEFHRHVQPICWKHVPWIEVELQCDANAEEVSNASFLITLWKLEGEYTRTTKLSKMEVTLKTKDNKWVLDPLKSLEVTEDEAGTISLHMSDHGAVSAQTGAPAALPKVEPLLTD